MLHRIDQTHDLRLDRNIHGPGPGPYRTSDLPGGVAIAIDDSHRRTIVREALAEPTPDAIAASGDDDQTAVYLHLQNIYMTSMSGQ